MKHLCFYCSTTFMTILLFSGIAMAEFSFTPSLKVREEYNDNINLTQSQKKDDFITSVSPSLMLGYSGENSKLHLNYGLEYRYYEKSTNYNKIYQRAGADAAFPLIRDFLFLNITDQFARVTIDERRPVALDNINTNQTDSNRLNINPYLIFPRSGSVHVRVGYNYENLWYQGTNGDDAQNHTANVSLSKDFSEKLSTTVGYSYLFHRLYRPEASRDRNYDRQTVTIGLTYKPSDKLLLSGTVGETFFDYIDTTGTISPRVTWNVLARYSPSERISFTANYSEDFVVSVDQGTSQSKLGSLGIAYNSSITLGITGEVSEQTYDAGRVDRYFGPRLDASIPFSQSFVMQANGSYRRYEFQQRGAVKGNEDVDRFSGRVSLEYTMKILQLSLGYTYNNNDSTDTVNNYTNNIAFVQATLTY